MDNAPRSKRLTENKPLEHLETHQMRAPPGRFTYVSAEYMEVFYHDANTGQSQLDIPINYLLADSWGRELSAENVEYFVERGYTEYWH